jgi:proteasome lid subunit RPN8/RPN11
MRANASALHMSFTAAAEIARHAEATYSDECVGLLLGRLADDGNRLVVCALALENRADSRHDRFYLDPRDYLWADRVARAAGLDIVGCYHSHPDQPAIPSERDREGAQGVGGGTGFTFVIQSLWAGKATELTAWLLVDTFVRQELVIACLM